MKPPRDLQVPLDETTVRNLRAGDAVTLSGRIYTARDRFHRHVADGGRCPVNLRGGVLFHCGPVILGPPNRWRVLAAGPTTSMREEPYMPAVIAATGIRVIIGKGGMGPDTRAACRRHGCVYVQATGGAAQFLRRRISAVTAVFFLDAFGPAEAMWELTVETMPGQVTIDSRGNSLYDAVADRSRRRLQELLA